jgi:GTPase SAR1 family protein
MYCLQTYGKNQVPDENQLLKQQLWNEATIKYGMKRTCQLLSTECNYRDFICDVDCRWRHLMNLISSWERYYVNRSPHQLIIDAKKMANKLSEIILCMKRIPDYKISVRQYAYKKAISSVDEEEIGSEYIRLCEDLQLEISNADCYHIFPKTYDKLHEWMHEQGSANEFKPKIPHLFKVIEEDLISQWSNTSSAGRTKIGVIGYTCSGKSSVLNRLLGVKSLRQDDAAPVSFYKSTYFPLQYDRNESLIDPDNSNRKTFVTFVDIQGLDKNRLSDNRKVEVGNYLDEIRKADCDIYILVYDEQFSEEQEEWIFYIEKVLKRKCVLVRSKIDDYYLKKFREYTNTYFGRSTPEQRNEFGPSIIQQLKQDNSIKSRNVHLVACDYCPATSDAEILLEEQSFDFPELLNELSRLAFDARSSRIHILANRAIARTINTTFRRGYVLNIMKYQVAAGVASIVPFGDQFPRHLARDSIRDAFGIDDALRQYLTQFHLIIDNYKLRTSVFEDCVEVRELQNNSKVDKKWIGRVAGYGFVLGGFIDDVVRIVTQAAITGLTGAARIAFTVSTVGVGVVISAGVSAWAAIDGGEHIFSYVNRICDDTFMISNPLIAAIIERERKKFFGNNNSTTSTTDSLQNNNDACL